jgi:putative hydrolases of HD superfamily
MEPSSKLDQQIAFLLEIDKLKNIIRRNRLVDGSRTENTAEHSWHIAILSAVLEEYSNVSVNLQRVLLLLLVHDIVEIDAGDTYAYDTIGYEDKEEREHLAAERIFSLLPENQFTQFKTLWLEFEEMETPESCFANAADRLMPLLHNYYSGGGIWIENKIRKSQVMERIAPMKKGSVALWEAACKIVEKAVADGYVINDEPF